MVVPLKIPAFLASQRIDMLRAILLCSAYLAVGALSIPAAPSTRTARHWDNWIYLKEAQHWHTLWCRWKPSGEEIVPAMYMERMFEPTDDGFSQKNIYHFEDVGLAQAPAPAPAPAQP